MNVLRRLRCMLVGHAVDNRRFSAAAAPPRCHDCGSPYLGLNGMHTRVRHTLSCFFGGHQYRHAGSRHGHNEYVCVRCGHPLLLVSAGDSSRRDGVFRKSVRYSCGLLGHRVHKVSDRLGRSEYACHCGHSFLREASVERTIRHPWICIGAGHFIIFSERRFGYSEFLCRNCGHTFSFRL